MMKPTYRTLFFTIALFLSFVDNVFAQDFDPVVEDIIKKYPTATAEQKSAIDSIWNNSVELWKSMQITSICGVPFGSSRTEATRILQNKFGEPFYLSDNNSIIYNNVKYAGLDFDSVYFLFQSDGFNSFFNACIFVKEAKNRAKANEISELYKHILSEKYNLSEETDDNGFKMYAGGISPLWKGNWYDFMTNLSKGTYLIALHTDVVKYDENTVNYLGNKYAVRIIYGPYQYVKEEF